MKIFPQHSEKLGRWEQNNQLIPEAENRKKITYYYMLGDWILDDESYNLRYFFMSEKCEKVIQTVNQTFDW